LYTCGDTGVVAALRFVRVAQQGHQLRVVARRDALRRRHVGGGRHVHAVGARQLAERLVEGAIVRVGEGEQEVADRLLAGKQVLVVAELRRVGLRQREERRLHAHGMAGGDARAPAARADQPCHQADVLRKGDQRERRCLRIGGLQVAGNVVRICLHQLGAPWLLGVEEREHLVVVVLVGVGVAHLQLGADREDAHRLGGGGKRE
jgi:hypothetical protein